MRLTRLPTLPYGLMLLVHRLHPLESFGEIVIPRKKKRMPDPRGRIALFRQQQAHALDQELARSFLILLRLPIVGPLAFLGPRPRRSGNAFERRKKIPANHCVVWSVSVRNYRYSFVPACAPP